MTAGGWVTMLLSVGFVTALFGWALYKVLKEPDMDSIHSTMEETPDIEE